MWFPNRYKRPRHPGCAFPLATAVAFETRLRHRDGGRRGATDAVPAAGYNFRRLLAQHPLRMIAGAFMRLLKLKSPGKAAATVSQSTRPFLAALATDYLPRLQPGIFLLTLISSAAVKLYKLGL